jgi:hypothetical protein
MDEFNPYAAPQSPPRSLARSRPKKLKLLILKPMYVLSCVTLIVILLYLYKLLHR